MEKKKKTKREVCFSVVVSRRCVMYLGASGERENVVAHNFQIPNSTYQHLHIPQSIKPYIYIYIYYDPFFVVLLWLAFEKKKKVVLRFDSSRFSWLITTPQLQINCDILQLLLLLLLLQKKLLLLLSNVNFIYNT